MPFNLILKNDFASGEFEDEDMFAASEELVADRKLSEITFKGDFGTEGSPRESTPRTLEPGSLDNPSNEYRYYR